MGLVRLMVGEYKFKTIMQATMRCFKKIIVYSGAAITALIIAVVSILVITNLVLTNTRVSKIITHQIESNLHAKVHCEVTHFSLFNGFEIQNFTLTETHSTTPVLRFDTLRLRYSLLWTLLGKIKIYEIGLYNPVITIEEKNGVWNVQRLLKEKKEEEIEEKAKEEKSEEKKGEITLPIPVEALFGLVLENCKVTVAGSSLHVTLNNFSANVRLHVPPTRHIPLNVLALTLFDTLNVNINPEEKLDLAIATKDFSAGPPVVFTFNLVYDPEKKELGSRFKCGTSRTPVRFTKKHLAPLNATIAYDIIYNPSIDTLECTSLLIAFGSSTWISFAGTIKDVNTKPLISCAMLDSNIRLNEVYQYTKVLVGEKPYFNGSVSIFPLIIRGDSNEVTVTGAIRGSRLAFSTDDVSVAVPSLEIPYMVKLGNRFVDVEADITLPHFVYTLQGNSSRDNGINFHCTIQFDRIRSLLGLRKLTIVHRAPELSSETVVCDVAGDIWLQDNVHATIEVKRLMLNLPSLSHTLPIQVKESLAASPITKPVTLKLSTEMLLAKSTNDVSLQALVSIPDFSIDDLQLSAVINQNQKKNTITISKCDIHSNKHAITFTTKGTIVKNEQIALNIKSALNIAPKKPVMFGDFQVGGVLDVALGVSGVVESLQVKGKLYSNNIIIRNDADKLFVGPVDMNIPIAYSMGKSYRMPFDAADILSIQLVKPKNNFSIGKVVTRHPTRDIAFEYVGGMHGYIGFNRNMMEIKEFQANVLGGTVTIKELNFNLADLNPQNMEYRLLLFANDIDIGKLDKPERVKIDKTSLLSLKAQLKGKNITFQQDFDASGSINIYKVGEKFANRLFKGLNEERGKSKLGIAQFAVDNSLVITGFDFYLDKGLVYPTVFFRKKVIGLFVTVNNEQVRYERIPIIEFFSKVKEETL